MEVDVTVPVSPLHWHKSCQVCPWSNSLGYRGAILRQYAIRRLGFASWSCCTHKTRARPAVCTVGWHFDFSFMSVMNPNIACCQKLRPEAECEDAQWSHCLDRRRVVYLLFALLTESKPLGTKRRKDGPFRAIGSRVSIGTICRQQRCTYDKQVSQ